MKAIGALRFGGPEVLQPVELPEPALGAGEVLIRVAAASVNPGDLGLRAGRFGGLGRPAPWILGAEVSGTVERVGSRVAEPFTRWDPVAAIIDPTDPHGGGYAELVAARADRVMRAPAGISLVEAATLPMNGLTAWMMLDAAHAEAPGVIGVVGASGMVGGYAVQLARAAGLTVIADAAPNDRALVQGLGATTVIPRGTGVLAALRAAAGRDLDAVLLAAPISGDAAAIVRLGGAVVSSIGVGGATAATARRRGVRVESPIVHANPDATRGLETVRRLAEGGQLWPRVAAELPAEQASEAHRRMAAGGVRGRIVLRF